MSEITVGFIGLGRLGLPLAEALLAGGFRVVATSRGKATELTARGGEVVGDGSARAVAEAADVVVTCLPSEAALEEVVSGPQGILAAENVPTLIESSTLSVDAKLAVRERFVARGADMLDAPVSGTPAMVKAKVAVVYASGERPRYDRFAGVVTAMGPNSGYVGDFGTGTKIKIVAQFLATVHATVTAQALALAELADLDLTKVVELLVGSPGATSGQFSIRGPMIAERRFEGRMTTVDMLLKDLGEIISFATKVGAPLDLLEPMEARYRALSAAGHGNADPAKLFDAVVGERVTAK